MLTYIICLFIIFFIVSFVMWVRYNHDSFDLLCLNFYSCGIGLIIVIISLVFASNYYDATIVDQFPKDYATYTANEDKLSEFELLNDEGMLSEDGKDKVLALTEFNVELDAEMDRKLEDTDASIKYQEKKSLIIKSVFTGVYSLAFGWFIFFAECDLRYEKKKEMVDLLTK